MMMAVDRNVWENRDKAVEIGFGNSFEFESSTLWTSFGADQLAADAGENLCDSNI